jgi:hypothetical protein
MGYGIYIDGTMDEELSSASRVTVSEQVGQPTTFQLRYRLSIEDGDIPLLIDDRLDPGREVSVIVPVEEGLVCLVKGPVHGQQIGMGHGGVASWLEVSGSDTSVVMDREAKSVVWSGVKDSDVVSTLLSGYGYAAEVEPTSSSHSEMKHTLLQRDSDLRFIRRLARRNGYLFWVRCDADGNETACFKRPPLDSDPETSLVINLDGPNVDTLSITWDVERPTSIEGMQLDLATIEVMDGSRAVTPQTLLGANSLQAVSGDVRSVYLSAPVDDSSDLGARSEGALIEADWFLRASCRTTLSRVGVPLRPHTVVEVQGMGSRHSGLYFVTSVVHSIDAVSHGMEIEMVRNGWGS